MPSSPSESPAANSVAEQTDPSAPASQQFLCPYCGHIADSPQRCTKCRGFFDPLSRQATQNAMGPWQVRSVDQPHQPGCSLATLKALIAKGKVTRGTVLRGPTTRQFWSFAANTPGVAALLGECHSCHSSVRPEEYMCAKCNAVLSPPSDRQSLGLAPVQLLPGQAPASVVASSSMATSARDGGSAPVQRPVARAPRPVAAAPRPAAAAPAPTDAVRHPTSRALQERVRFLTGLLIFAVVSVCALLAILALIIVTGSSSIRLSGAPSRSQPSATTAAPSAAPATGARRGAVGDEAIEADGEALDADEAVVAAPRLPSHGLDIGLDEWARDIAQASEMEKLDTVAGLERALVILERVREEARAAVAARGEEAVSYPLLEARIERLTERADRLRLREMLD